MRVPSDPSVMTFAKRSRARDSAPRAGAGASRSDAPADARYLPAGLKRLLLRRLFGVILRQDKAILEQTQANRLRFAMVPPLDTELDLLGPAIRQLLRGEQLDPALRREVSAQL